MNIHELFEDASGVIATKKQAKDPRYSMSLTKDVRPGEIQRQLKKYALAEDQTPDLKSVGNKFVKFVKQQLELKELPTIKLVKEIGSSEHPTFGLFDPNTNTVNVAYKDRHIMDVLRTLGHELVHHKQREDDRIKPGDGETGSEIENEANAQAGVLMRDFADQNPGLFSNQINEVGNNPYQMPARWLHGNKSVVLPSGKVLSIDIDSSYEFVVLNFDIDGRKDITGDGNINGDDVHRIFATVGQALDDYARKKKPAFIVFTGALHEPSRTKLYDRLADRWLKLPALQQYINVTYDESVWPYDLESRLDDIQDVEDQTIYVLMTKSYYNRY